jgi:hypothetical protein
VEGCGGLPEFATTSLAARLLGEELECALLGYIARLPQTSDGLLAGGVLLLAHNAAVLVLDEVLACQATRCVFGCAVEYLSLCTDCLHVCFLPKQHIFFNGVRHSAGFRRWEHLGLEPRLYVF